MTNKTETEEMAYNLALAWFETKYTQEQAQYSAEQQGIPFPDVVYQYGCIYHECEAMAFGVQV